MSDPLLTNIELRVLRAVDNRPGLIASAYAGIATGLGEEVVDLALEHLERAELVRPSTIWRTGAKSWRITRTGIDQLIGNQARANLRDRANSQLELGLLR